MRLESITVRGLGPFHESATLDMADVQGPLVAITGANGAGKSTLLELLGGAIYRTCPTRGPLGRLATCRDALLEARVATDRAYVLRHLVDAVSGKGESVVLDGDGEPLTTSAKKREFDAWAGAHLPAAEVFYAGQFAVQGERGFAGQKPGERKATLLRALGLEHLEALAAKAREHARDAEQESRVLRARVDDAVDGAAVGGVFAEGQWGQREAQEADEKAIVIDALATRSEEALAEARAAHQQADADEERERERAARRAATCGKIVAVQARIVGIDERLRNNRAVIADAAAIRKAEAQAEELDTAARAQALEVTTLEKGLAATESELSGLRQRGAEIGKREERLSASLAEREDVLRARDGVGSAARELVEAEATLEATRAAIKAARAEEQKALDTVMALDTRRIAGLRDGLNLISVGVSAPRVAAHTILDHDDAMVVDGDSARHVLAEVERAEDLRETQLRNATARVDGLRRIAARAGEMERAEAEASALRGELAELAEHWQEFSDTTAAAEARLRELHDQHRRAVDELTATRSVRGGLETMLRRVSALTSAEARVAELSSARLVAEADLDALLEEHAALSPEEAWSRPPLPDLERARLRAQTDRTEATRARRRADKLRDDATRLKALHERLKGLRAELRAASGQHADWARVGRDLGRDGIQALEIDAAGPELTELANDLLHECVGPRFSVEIRTQRASADGKRELEGCDVMVIDTVGGRDAPIETYSGGECVIVGEAISLALTVLACRHSGVERPTLIRDETGAALDPARGRAYVEMLRRAADMVGAEHVLFVSHSPELQALADSRVEVRAGRLVVDGVELAPATDAEPMAVAS